MAYYAYQETKAQRELHCFVDHVSGEQPKHRNLSRSPSAMYRAKMIRVAANRTLLAAPQSLASRAQ